MGNRKLLGVGVIVLAFLVGLFVGVRQFIATEDRFLESMEAGCIGPADFGCARFDIDLMVRQCRITGRTVL